MSLRFSSSSWSSQTSNLSAKEQVDMDPLTLLSKYSLPEEVEGVNPFSLLSLYSIPEEEIKPLRLLSADCEFFTVQPNAARQSGTLKNLLENVRYSGIIRVPKVTAKALTVVIIYCTEHANKTELLNHLRKFDNNLLGKLDDPLLHEIVKAATQLCIPGLQEAISLTVANKEFLPTADKEQRADQEDKVSKVARRMKKPFKKLMGFVKAHSAGKSHGSAGKSHRNAVKSNGRTVRPLMIKKG